MIWRILTWACRLFLGGIFIYAGIAKVGNPLQFAAAVEGYQLISTDLVIRVVKILPWLEIILGAVLLLGFKIRYTAGLAGTIMVFFIGVMLLTYLRGLEVDCGCFGTGEKISLFTLVREALFLLPALFLVIRPWLEKGFRVRFFSDHSPER